MPNGADPPLDLAQPAPWTEARLGELGAYELDFQEFKGSAYLTEKGQISGFFHQALSKQLSAFANGAGGRIFIGLDDDGQIDGGVPTDLKPGGTRSWLEDIIPGLVDPRLARFNVHEIPHGGPASAVQPGHAVYVVEIPASDEAPHQAIDHRYYLRIGGKSRPMGHVHLQDILRRTRHPVVDLTRVGPYGVPERITTDPRGPKVFIAFRIFLTNRGRILARHVGAEILIPRALIGREVRQRNLAPGDIHLTQSPGTITLFRYHPAPLFPSQEVFGQWVWISVHAANRDTIRSGQACIRWRVYADDAIPRVGEQPLWRFAVVRDAVAWVEAALAR